MAEAEQIRANESSLIGFANRCQEENTLRTQRGLENCTCGLFEQNPTTLLGSSS